MELYLPNKSSIVLRIVKKNKKECYRMIKNKKEYSRTKKTLKKTFGESFRFFSMIFCLEILEDFCLNFEDYLESKKVRKSEKTRITQFRVDR